MYVKITSLVFCHVFRCYLWNDPHVPSVKVDLIIILIVICCQQLWMSSQWKVQFLSVWRQLPEPTTFLSGWHRLISRTGSTENIENIVSLMWMWWRILNIGVFAKSIFNVKHFHSDPTLLTSLKTSRLGAVWTHLVRFPDPLALPKARWGTWPAPTCLNLTSTHLQVAFKWSSSHLSARWLRWLPSEPTVNKKLHVVAVVPELHAERTIRRHITT